VGQEEVYKEIFEQAENFKRELTRHSQKTQQKLKSLSILSKLSSPQPLQMPVRKAKTHCLPVKKQLNISELRLTLWRFGPPVDAAEVESAYPGWEKHTGSEQ
jgi:hypothetical protein